MAERETTETAIVGAGPSGLAVAAMLKARGRPFVLLERAASVGSTWRAHYDRLHLHTAKAYSGLPGLPFPREAPTYPSREQVVSYLDGYAAHFGLAPRLDEAVTSARFVDGRWELETSKGALAARFLVVATGYNGVPVDPGFPGRERFRGEVLHSSVYRNGARWKGKRVLVVGIGNSGAEIALDLIEHGVNAHIAVRGPIHVSKRDILGVPAQMCTIALSKLPIAVADAIAGRLARVVTGDLSRYGITRPAKGPFRMIEDHGRIPLIDIGTVAKIRSGELVVVPGVAAYVEEGVQLVDGRTLPLDAIVLATGYRAGLERFLSCAAAITTERGLPGAHGEEVRAGGVERIYFVGYRNPVTGMLREIALQAVRVADSIARYAAAPIGASAGGAAKSGATL